MPDAYTEREYRQHGNLNLLWGFLCGVVLVGGIWAILETMTHI